MLGSLLVLACFAHLFVGNGLLDWQLLFTHGLSEQQWFVLEELRLPRMLMAIFVGAGLAVAGVALQSLFRNPLAEPGLIGVASSSALGAVFIMVLGNWIWQQVALWQIGLSAFLSGLLVTILIYRLATRSGQTDVALMLLAGVAVNAIMGAGTQLLMSIASSIQLQTVTFWLMGSLVNLSWTAVLLVTTVTSLGILYLATLVRGMNAFVIGETSAGYMGFDTHRFKWQVMIVSALMVSVSVALVGVIGFIGLVVPHMVRLWVGADHRLVLPFSALAGALLLVVADWLAQNLLHPVELPIGLLMALIGAPFFLMMLLKRRWQ